MPASLTLERIFHDFGLEFSEFVKEFPGFEKFYKTKMKNMSGGERRIVEIFVILTSDTKFCLLDEPFSRIMPVHIDKIKELISGEKKKKGIIITDHLYRHIMELSDELYLIRDGTTHLIKNPEEIEILGYARI